MRRVSMISALSIMASLLVSGPLTTGAPALASTNSPARTTVTGVFKDAVTGDPVAGACISLYRASVPIGTYRTHLLARACSGASGVYSLPDLPVGFPHYAYLEAPGYGGQWYPGYADMPIATVFTGSVAPTQTRDITVKRATAGVSVHLTRQDGSPAAYASVQVMVPAGTIPVALMRTDANGDVSRTDIPAGDYKIRFLNTGYPTQWYQGKTAVADGQLVTLKAGETLSLTDQLVAVDPMPTPPPLFTAYGTVRAQDGTPIAGATVTAMAPNSSLVFGSATTGPNGAYSVTTVPNSVGLIKVSAPGYATVWNSDDPLPVSSVPLAANHDFVLRPGSGTIRGTLTDSVPGPIPAYTSLTVTAADGWGYAVAYVGYDGTFEIPNMPAGTYTLNIAPTGRPNQQIQNVVVRDGQVTTADARLLDPGRLRVRVVDDMTGQPIEGATVTTITNEYQTRTSDAEGYAEFGDYWQSAVVQYYAAHNPYHFLSPSQTATVAPGTTTEVTLRMRPGAVLTVPVRNVDSAYDICLYLKSPNPPDGFSFGDCRKPTNGVVTYGPLEPGTYRAFLRPTWFPAGAQWVADSGGTGAEKSATALRLTAGSTTAAPEQRFGAAGSITGKVIDPKTREVVQGCVQIASNGVPISDCTDSAGVYRLDGLGPYAWPLFFNSNASPPHGSIWSGGATTHLDAKLVQVTSGGTATYNFAPGAALWFDIQPPTEATPNSWILDVFDAQTGDIAGGQSWWGYSNIGPGPKLLRFHYSADGFNHTCWMQRPAILRDERPDAVYYGGSSEHPAHVTVVLGKNCLATVPSIVRITPAPGNLKPLFPGHPPTPRQEVSVPGRSAVAGAPSIAATEPQTFNELVQSSFDSALQLAIGALP